MKAKTTIQDTAVTTAAPQAAVEANHLDDQTQNHSKIRVRRISFRTTPIWTEVKVKDLPHSQEHPIWQTFPRKSS